MGPVDRSWCLEAVQFTLWVMLHVRHLQRPRVPGPPLSGGDSPPFHRKAPRTPHLVLPPLGKCSLSLFFD